MKKPQALTWFAVAMFGLLGCQRHLRLVSPDTTGSSLYTCNETGCSPSEVDNPALFNQSGTKFIASPKQCAGRIHEVVILDAASSSPTIYVRCAPIEAPLPEPCPQPGPSLESTGTTPVSQPLPEMGSDEP
jgi:hypothetical protein